MGKSDQTGNGVPAISPETEASKLLEAALMQMDGIISGNTGSLTAHSPDYGFASSPPGVREAANSLVTALQACPAPPPPEPGVVKLIWDWLQMHGTVEEDDSLSAEDEVTFLLRLRPTPSPPTRRRRHSLDHREKESPSKGWNVFLQHKDGISKRPPLSPPPARKTSSNELKDERKKTPKPPSRKFFGHKKRKDESPGWDVIIERQDEVAPPVPPRVKPSAPPQELSETFWLTNGYYLPPDAHPFGDRYSNGYFSGSVRSSLSECTPQNNFGSFSPAEGGFSMPGMLHQSYHFPSQATAFVHQHSQNSNEEGYVVTSAGFHGAASLSQSAMGYPTTPKPPVPSPRNSLASRTHSPEIRDLLRAHSDMTLHLTVCEALAEC